MGENLKILILQTYFERPTLVKGFLRSLMAADRLYQNWELAFIDDGSQEPGRPIVERILRDRIDQVKFYNSNMTTEMKRICGGSFMGKFMNQAIQESSADLSIMVGDDDEIYPDYLKNLDVYFQAHPDVLSAYSGVHVYNPLVEKSCNTHNLYSDNPSWKGHAWFGRPIAPAFKVDGVQVAWRTLCNKVHGAWFPSPIILNHDAEFFEELYDRCGPSEYTGFIAMYKGRHDGQLIHRIKSGGGAFGENRKVIEKPRDILFL